MNYKVIPFKASISSVGSSQSVAQQLQGIIDKASEEGWTYVSMDNISTYVAGTSGCFGLGATQGYTTSVQVLIFQRGE